MTLNNIPIKIDTREDYNILTFNKSFRESFSFDCLGSDFEKIKNLTKDGAIVKFSKYKRKKFFILDLCICPKKYDRRVKNYTITLQSI